MADAVQKNHDRDDRFCQGQSNFYEEADITAAVSNGRLQQVLGQVAFEEWSNDHHVIG
jgi:hypothetical protein